MLRRNLVLLKRLFFLNVLLSSVFIALFFMDWRPSEAITVVYGPLAILDQAFLLNLLAAIVALPLIFLKDRLIALPFIVIQLAILTDFSVFRIYRFHIDFFFVEMFFREFAGLGLSWLNLTFIILAIVVLAALLFVATYAFATSKKTQHAGKYLLVIFVVSFIGQCIHAWGYAHNYREILRVSPLVPWYLPMTATPEVKALGLFDAGIRERQLSLKLTTNGSFHYPKSPLSCAPETPPNIIYVILESWRFDRMTPEITPNIYQIGQDSMTFTDHLSGGNVTTNGMFSLFFGMSSVFKQQTEATGSLPNLVSSLDSLGYDFHILANQDIIVNNLNTQLFGGKPTLQSAYGGSNGIGDAQLISKLTRAIRPDSPYFAMVFFNDSHFPYRTADDFRQPFQPAQEINFGSVSDTTDPTPFLNQYSNAIHYLDHLVGKLKTHLKETNQWDNTIVVITGDHGEEFNDNGSGYWGHGSKFDRFQLGVPLVVHWPGINKSINYRTAHEDIASTLLVEGLSCNNSYADIGTGQSLFSDTPRAILAESYVNKAFIKEETVYEIMPGYVETYGLDGQVDVKTHDNILGSFTKIQTWFQD